MNPLPPPCHGNGPSPPPMWTLGLGSCGPWPLIVFRALGEPRATARATYHTIGGWGGRDLGPRPYMYGGSGVRRPFPEGACQFLVFHRECFEGCVPTWAQNAPKNEFKILKKKRQAGPGQPPKWPQYEPKKTQNNPKTAQDPPPSLQKNICFPMEKIIVQSSRPCS